MEKGRNDKTAMPLRESSRKRVRKSLGPDFVEDYTKTGKISPDIIPPKLKINFAGTRIDALHQGIVKKEFFVNEKVLRSCGMSGPLNAGSSSFTSSFTDLSTPECDVCKKSMLKVDNDEILSTMLICTGLECDYRAHAKCLFFSAELTRKVKKTFKCLSCQRCVMCGEGQVSTDASADLVLCSDCDCLFHLNCHKPPIDFNGDELKDLEQCFAPNWKCAVCKDRSEFDKKKLATVVPLLRKAPVVTVTSSNGLRRDKRLRKPCAIPRRDSEESNELSQRHSARNGLRNRPVKSNYWKLEHGNNSDSDNGEPEETRMRRKLARWTSEQCAIHFRNMPNFALAIRQHRMTGATLLMIKRAEIVEYFGFKLGPALKYHRAVCQWRQATF